LKAGQDADRRFHSAPWHLVGLWQQVDEGVAEQPASGQADQPENDLL